MEIARRKQQYSEAAQQRSTAQRTAAPQMKCQPLRKKNCAINFVRGCGGHAAQIALTTLNNFLSFLQINLN